MSLNSNGFEQEKLLRTPMIRFSKITIYMLACIGFTSPADAVISQWQDLGGGKARIFATKNPETNVVEGVIEVKLDPGWKTYWRSPGGAGIAPEFDFSNSQAFSLSEISYPVPQWIELDGAAFFGYKEHASFIFSGLAEEYSASVNLDMLIGVCEEICIPATASFQLSAADLNASDPQVPVRVELAKAKLPQTADNSFNSLQFRAGSGEIVAELLDAKEGDINKLVIFNNKGWVSDPIKFQPNETSEAIAVFKLPSDSAGDSGETVNWSYSLMRLSGEDHSVTSAVDGDFKITKQ